MVSSTWQRIKHILLSFAFITRSRSQLPVLPIEVWERVIDHLWLDTVSLRACTLVCKKWAQRTRYHLLSYPDLWDREQVVQLAKLVQSDASYADALTAVVIRGARNANQRAPIPQLGTFAVMFARKLENLQLLEVNNAEWHPGGIHPHIFLHLSAYVSVTTLSLVNVNFPSLQVFGRLVCSLPGLEHLACWDVTFAAPSFHAKNFYTPSTKLTRLSLSGNGSDEIVGLLITTSIAATLKVVWLGHWEPLPIGERNTHATQQLLEAMGSSLEMFSINFVDNERISSQSKAAGTAIPGVAVELASKSDSTSGFPVDLVHNTSLTSLCLKTSYRGNRQDSSWMPAVFAGISSRKLKDIILLCDLRWYCCSDNCAVLCNIILDVVDAKTCNALDELFDNQVTFPELETLTFILWVAAGDPTPSANAVTERLSNQFHALHAQKGLRVFIGAVSPLDVL